MKRYTATRNGEILGDYSTEAEAKNKVASDIKNTQKCVRQGWITNKQALACRWEVRDKGRITDNYLCYQ